MDILSPQSTGLLDQQQGMVRKIDPPLYKPAVARLVKNTGTWHPGESDSAGGPTCNYMVHYKAEDGEMSIAQEE